LSYYTFPDPRYGITWNGFAQASGTATFPAGASSVFKTINLSKPVPVEYSYFYGATPVAAAGETTTPVLTINGQIAGVVHRKADGREYMALTMDNNPYLLHSLVLGYDLVSWVTKGVFIGERKAYFSPQIDDIFIGSDLYSLAPGCQPTGFRLDPTVDPTSTCNVLRITGGDLTSLAQWQNQINSQYGTAIKINMAFNGFGTTAAGGATPNDPLAAAGTQTRSQFFWVTHTYDHENLDCYEPVPNSGVCKPAT
jgi:hypothetical protein